MKRNSIVLIIGLLLCANSTSAQLFRAKNQWDVDMRKQHFFFGLGTTFQSLQFTQNPDIELPALYTENGGVGLLVLGGYERKLNDYFSVLTTPNFYIHSGKSIAFADSTINIASGGMNFPLGFRITGVRFNNYRPYFYIGASASIDLIGTALYDKQKKYNDGVRFIKPLSFYTDFAIGIDCYLEEFKPVIELRFSLGLNDILSENKYWGNRVSSVTQNSVSLVLFFE